MSLFALMARRKRRVIVEPPPPPPPPPSGTGLAVPRSGVTATGIPSNARFGQCADFYDTFGTNVHPRDEAFRMPGYLTALVELGGRHIRGEWAPSFIDSRGQDYRHFWGPIHRRNQTIPVGGTYPGEQPIFASLLPMGSKGYYAFTFRIADSGNPASQFYDPNLPEPTVNEVYQAIEGGQQHRNPGWGSLIPNGTTSNPSADVPNPWNIADPEYWWDLVSGIQGQNEYGTDGTGGLQRYTTALSSSKAFHSEYFRKAKERTNTQCYGSMRSHPVVFENGIGVNPTVNELPTVGPSVINAGHAQTIGDWTGDATVKPYTDFGDQHPYHPGLEPNHLWYDVNVDGTTGSLTSGLYNGNLRNPPDRTKAYDWWYTEIGYITSGFNIQTNAHSGYWPARDNVNAEYFVRDLVMCYWRGVRRMFQYFFWDSGTNLANPEHNFGIIKNNGTKKESFYALRNLLSLVEFKEAPSASKAPVTFTVTGFTAQGAHYDEATNRMVQSSDGINQHRAMWGSEAPGSWHNSLDRLEPVLLQQSANTYVLILCRHVTLWDREPGNWNLATNQPQMFGNEVGGNYTPPNQTLTINFPGGITSAVEATPTAGGITTPEDGRTWSAPKTLTHGPTGTSVTVSIAGKTKLLKVVAGAPSPPASPKLPIVVPQAGAVDAVLRQGSTSGVRLQFRGVNVWGLADDITNNVTVGGTAFHQQQYNARSQIAAQIKSWGCNIVRFRMLADSYNGAPSANTDNLTKAQLIQRVKDWRDVVVAQGMYFMPCSWDALDGAFSGAGWAGNGFRVHQMFTDLKVALGNDPMVIYEVTNEPNNVTLAQWDTNMRASILHFRETMGYKGLLVIDPINWANSGIGGATNGGYDDTYYSGLETYDAARAGMGGIHQLAFAKHDYANEYAGTTWSAAAWETSQGGSQGKHLIFETEFGNSNLGVTSPTWSANASTFFSAQFLNEPNYVGACAFLWGPWSDLNSITAADNATPTTWGQTVKTNFMGNPVTPPPPQSGFTPGVVSNAAQNAADNGVSLGAEVMRVEFSINLNVSAAGASRTTMDSWYDYFADRGIRILPLAGFQSYNAPTTGQAGNLGSWAQRYGPGGDFWVARGADGNLASQFIEFGNELNYNYQAGGGNAAEANAYGQRCVTAKNAILATGKAVGLLCMGMPSDSQNAAWLNNMFIGAPTLASVVDGWTIHPYGPDYITKLQNHITQLGNHGVPNTVPVDITEIGVASDQIGSTGRQLNDNYGWPKNMTYATAASTLATIVQNTRNHATIGPRIRYFMVYQARNNKPSGGGVITGDGTPDKEGFFGALLDTGAEKGAYSPAVRNVMAM